MKYVDEFRNQALIAQESRRIKKIAPADPVHLMEVCGTHTQSFYRFGLNTLLPATIKLIAGPGCPVCVSDQEYIDKAIVYAKEKDTLILTFADMLRVPGSTSTLEKERAAGARVQALYSPLDSLTIARKNPKKKVIFLGVGFETTASTIALSVLSARREKIKNIYFFNSLKLIPPAMRHLLTDKRLALSGFLCPGHVSSIIGTKPYAFIPRHYNLGCCVAGFEPLDILEGIYLLLKQIVNKKPAVDNQYIRAVTAKGNTQAQKVLSSVFCVADVTWRGLGRVPKSGLLLRNGFSRFDAEKEFPIKRIMPGGRGTTGEARRAQCRCGEVLKGLITPQGCPLFKRACSPENPFGPCMVSQEGACNAFYRYKK